METTGLKVFLDWHPLILDINKSNRLLKIWLSGFKKGLGFLSALKATNLSSIFRQLQ